MPRARKPSSRPTDAIAVLKKDHEKVRKLLAQLERTSEKSAARRETLLRQIEKEVKVHTTVEEEVFYPAYRDAVKKKEDREIFFEAVEEHHVVDLVMPEIDNTGADTEQFGAKAKVLKDLIEHHADEEEKQMFPKARKVLSRDELRELGEQITARKRQLQSVAK